MSDSNEVNTFPPIPKEIAFITGPTMVGIVLNWFFMGVLVPQTYYYSTHFPRDPFKMKFLVYFLVILDATQSIMVMADAFHWFVFGYGNMNRLDEAFLNPWDVPFFDALIAVIVQGFYCWRIFVLRKDFWVPSLVFLVSLTGFGAGIAVSVEAQAINSLRKIGGEIKQQATWLAASALADVLITVVLAWTLSRSRSKDLPGNQRMIGRIIRVTVETNSLTAGVSLIALILYLGVPAHSPLVVPPTAIIGKLYTNSLVAVLNNRAPQQGSEFKGNSSSVQRYGGGASTYGRGNIPAELTPIGSQTHSANRFVKVDVLQHVHHDDIELEDGTKSTGKGHGL